jgi:predicted nicotinamide N-methyase
VTIRLRYQTVEFGEIDIHIRTLRDNQQYEDKNQAAEKLGISSATWPLFGILWPSSLELAKYISSLDIANKRILEVGCGIGLSSLLLNHIHADITATDIHPCAQEFLGVNTVLNNDRVIPFERLDWNSANSTLGRFDLIIGSDLLYESNHPVLLSNFIDNHANKSCEVIIIDPGRGQQGKFIKIMLTMGYSHMQGHLHGVAAHDNDKKYKLMRFSR